MGLTRGRVIAEASGATALTPVPSWSGLRRREQVAAREQARTLLDEARREAAAAHDQARREAEERKAQALDEGRQAAEAAVAARWVEVKQAEERWLREREGDLIALARLLAERLLLRSLDLDPRTIVDLTRQAMAPLRRARRLALHVHPDDAEALRAGVAALGQDVDLIEVNLDSTAPRGAVRIVTELGTIRAELAPQLDRLVAALRAP